MKISFKVHKDQTLEFTSISTSRLGLIVCTVPQTLLEKCFMENYTLIQRIK